MIEFDAANAAVEAALAAGARYADARVMHRRHESMSARNGEVRELVQDQDSGLGVRALVGSGWGFFAVPDVSDPAARAAGARAAEIAAASGRVPGPAADLVPLAAQSGSWANECLVDPLDVPLSVKGDLLVGVTGQEGEPAATDGGPAVSEVDGPAADSEVARLVAGVDRGVLVTDHWYTRVLDPRTLVMTGLTRNGVWLIESGQIVRPVRNMRFTQSYPEALGPGAVLGVGRRGYGWRPGTRTRPRWYRRSGWPRGTSLAAHPADRANPATGPDHPRRQAQGPEPGPGQHLPGPRRAREAAGAPRSHRAGPRRLCRPPGREVPGPRLTQLDRAPLCSAAHDGMATRASCPVPPPGRAAYPEEFAGYVGFCRPSPAKAFGTSSG